VPKTRSPAEKKILDDVLFSQLASGSWNYSTQIEALVKKTTEALKAAQPDNVRNAFYNKLLTLV
jgi:hypothetical protein